MANHGYISSKKNLKKDQVFQDLQEINNRKFQGLLTIDPAPGWGDNAWLISHNHDESNGFIIWICSARKLEHRHTHGWSFYLEITFANELGIKYGGKISDDCCEEKWDPRPNEYPTFKSWIEEKNFLLKDSNSPLYDKMVELEMKTCPMELRHL